MKIIEEQYTETSFDASPSVETGSINQKKSFLPRTTLDITLFTFIILILFVSISLMIFTISMAAKN